MAPSVAYKYFIVSDGTPIAVCKLCNSSIMRRIRDSSFDSSNLIRHIRGKHPGVLDLPPPNLDTPLPEKPQKEKDFR